MPFGPKVIGYFSECGRVFCPECAATRDTASLLDSIDARNCAVDGCECDECGAAFAFSTRCADYVALVRVRGRWVDPADIVATVVAQ